MRDPREHEMELWIGNMLRIGMLVSAAIVFLGGILYLAQFGKITQDYHHFRGEAARLTNIPQILRSAWLGDARALIGVGLLLLIATPVLRVAVSAYFFAWQRDYLYVTITLLVLTLLSFSLLG